MAQRRVIIEQESGTVSSRNFSGRGKPPSQQSTAEAGARSETVNRRFNVTEEQGRALLAEFNLPDEEVPAPSEKAIQAVLRGLRR